MRADHFRKRTEEEREQAAPVEAVEPVTDEGEEPSGDQGAARGFPNLGEVDAMADEANAYFEAVPDEVADNAAMMLSIATERLISRLSPKSLKCITALVGHLPAFVAAIEGRR